MSAIKIVILLIVLIFFNFVASQAQFEYQFSTQIPVKNESVNLKNPWAGGINSGQFFTADVSGNQEEELVIFDRTNNQVSVFEWKDENWIFNPTLAHQFPTDLTAWIYLADYNQDGLKDIFAHTPGGVKVYKNTSTPGKPASWSLVKDLITYNSDGRQVNILVNSTDIPAFEDVDGDGDLDILAFDGSGIGHIELYLNMNKEQDSGADQFPFTLGNSKWGGIKECGCDNIAFSGADCSTNQRAQHVGGKAILLYDLNGDAQLDLIFSDEECTGNYFLINAGTTKDAVFNNFQKKLPGSTQEISLPFPAVFKLDSNKDGVLDLLFSSNFSRNNTLAIPFHQSAWSFINQGTKASPSFTFEQTNFLQNSMIDIGEDIWPVFFDIDADGDQDLLLGSKGMLYTDGFYATLQLYINTGTTKEPSFELLDENYLNFKDKKVVSLYPQLTDFNQDGKQDLVYQATDAKSFQTKLFVALNTSANSIPDFDVTNAKEIPFPLSRIDYPFFFDVDKDGVVDLLLGRFDGSLSYYRNKGTVEAPAFELITKTFGGLSLDNYKRPLVPTVGDTDLDGNPDLITTDGTGTLTIYPDFLNQNSSSFTGQEVQVQLENSYQSSQFGSFSKPVTALLWQDKMPAVVIGSRKGGLYILQKATADTLPPNPSLVFEIYPNPSTTGSVTIKSNFTAVGYVYNIAGQLISQFTISKNSPTEFSTATLSHGVYIVKLVGKQGKSTRRIIIL